MLAYVMGICHAVFFFTDDKRTPDTVTEVRTSLLEDTGIVLFAKEMIKPNDRAARYHGELITPEVMA